MMLVGLGCLVSYKIGKQLNIQVHQELDERRRKFAAA